MAGTGSGGPDAGGGPRAVFGATLYNHAAYLAESLDSLLGQTVRDFRLILVDDASTDETPAIARRYAAADARVTYHRNEARLGMVANWKKAFELARALYPASEYFAWASDHDVWSPAWLERLLDELDRHPEAVLAYPKNERISATGEVIRPPWSFDIADEPDPRERLRIACVRGAAGDMVYGLIRADALARAGVFRPLLMPDRLLIAELAIYGTFRQVDEVLWRRRFASPAERGTLLERQRRALFGGASPAYARLPWWLTHGGALALALGVRGDGRPLVGRRAGLVLAYTYVRERGTVELKRKLGPRKQRLKQRLAPYASPRATKKRLRRLARSRRLRALVPVPARRLARALLAKGRA